MPQHDLSQPEIDPEEYLDGADDSGAENDDQCHTGREQEQEQLFSPDKRSSLTDRGAKGLRRRGGPAYPTNKE